MFISLEGPEGAGKSTVAGELHEALLRAGRRSLLTYEPGGTDLGRQVREVVRYTGGRSLDSRAETLLFCASRAQLVEEVIRPHLRSGGVVICDRYADSTLAYQCHGRGLPLGPVRAALAFATDGIWPTLTILLDLEVREGLRRKQGHGDAAGPDRFESESVEFHERVRRGYLELAAAEPARWLVVDAGRPPDEVVAVVLEEVGRRLNLSAEGGQR